MKKYLPFAALLALPILLANCASEEPPPPPKKKVVYRTYKPSPASNPDRFEAVTKPSSYSY